MRHPKNPFSPDEPDDDAVDLPRDRHELAADAAPGRGSGTPPPLPRRKGDSGFRPRDGQAPPQQDFWPLIDPEDSWPLAPRPPAEPAGYCSPGGREDSWAAPAPAQGGRRDDGGQEAGPEEAWAASGPAQSGPRDYEAQADPRDDWAQAEPEEPWAAYGPAEGDPPASWGQGGKQEFWSPDSRPHGAPRDPSRPPPAREDLRGEDLRGPVRGAVRGPVRGAVRGPVRGTEPPPRRARGRGDHSAPGSTGRGDLPPGGDHFFPAPARFTGRLQGGARPPEDSRPPERFLPAERSLPPESPRPPEDLRPPERSLPPENLRPPQDDLSWEDEQRCEDEHPRSERVPAAAAGPAADQEGDPAPASTGFQDLWESWEPPYDPVGAISEPVRHPTAPYPELVRDTEYEDDLGFWETPAEAGPGGGPRYPDYPGPRRAGPARTEPRAPAPERRASGPSRSTGHRGGDTTRHPGRPDAGPPRESRPEDGSAVGEPCRRVSPRADRRRHLHRARRTGLPGCHQRVHLPLPRPERGWLARRDGCWQRALRKLVHLQLSGHGPGRPGRVA